MGLVMEYILTTVSSEKALPSARSAMPAARKYAGFPNLPTSTLAPATRSLATRSSSQPDILVNRSSEKPTRWGSTTLIIATPILFQSFDRCIRSPTDITAGSRSHRTTQNSPAVQRFRTQLPPAATVLRVILFVVHEINGSVGTREGRLRMAFQCSRKARLRSSALPLAFQWRPEKVVMSNGRLAPSRTMTMVGRQRPSA